MLFQPTRESMEEHRKGAVQDHMDLLLDELKSLSTEFYSFVDKNNIIGSKSTSSSSGWLSSSMLMPNPLSTFMHPKYTKLIPPEEKSFYSEPSVTSHYMGVDVPMKQLSDLTLNKADEYGLAGGTDSQVMKSELLRMKSNLSEKTAALEDSSARMGKLENKIEVR